MKIKLTRHYVWVERIKSKDNSDILPSRTNSVRYRDNWTTWKHFLYWCFGSEKTI